MNEQRPRPGDSSTELRVDDVRRRLIAFLATSSSASPRAWGFALYPREHPCPLRSRVVGIVTTGDSLALTHRMMLHLWPGLWMEGEVGRVELVPLCPEPELLDESLPGLLLRTWEDGNRACRTFALSARDLPASGLLLVSDRHAPPPGWPR